MVVYFIRISIKQIELFCHFEYICTAFFMLLLAVVTMLVIVLYTLFGCNWDNYWRWKEQNIDN